MINLKTHEFLTTWSQDDQSSAALPIGRMRLSDGRFEFSSSWIGAAQSKRFNPIESWNWDVGAEFRISIKKPGLQGLRP